MSWHYLRELEGESLEDICSGGELLQPLKSKINHAEFYCNGKLMDSYLDSLSGMTSEHSMENLGEEKSMLSQVDSLVKTFQPQEKAQVLTEKGQDSGEKWQGSFVKFNLDTSSWRTHQCSLLGDLESFSETWPQWGLMRNGECWEQTTLVQTTKGKGYGLEQKWPTPNAWDGKRGPMSKELMETGKHQISLVTAVKHNPTRWGTPKAQDSRHALRDRGKGNLGEQVSGIHNGGKLNPLWTEWLMGWWIGWTDLKPLVMDKSPCVPQPHGES